MALLDGQLTSTHNEGALVAAALRQKIPGVKVVDVSAFGDAIKDADAKMPKTKYEIDRLGKMITEL